MISYVKGKIDAINLASVIVENNGIGYEIFVSPSTIAKLSGEGSEVKIYTYFQVKEDNVGLYGFITKEELSMFYMLISVSGIGPKSALNMLASSSPQDLMLAIISDDVAAMSRLPGIGKKTAGRLILELKDKIKTQDVTSYDFGADIPAQSGESSPKNDGVSALCALGYSRSEAVKAVVSIYEDGMDIKEIIKAGLKFFSKQ